MKKTTEHEEDIAPYPWDYNPSSWKQRISISIIASIALIVAVYMGLYQWKLIDSVWDPFFGLQTQNVLDSDVSHTMYRWFRIPDAIFGALAYLGDVIYGLAGSIRRWQYRPWLVLFFGIDVIPLGIVSAILVALQGLVVGSWCFLCLVTAVISLILVIMAFDEVYTSILYLRECWKLSHDKKVIWQCFCGYPNEIGYQAGLIITSKKAKKHVGKNR